MIYKHKPVLLKEAVELLNVKPGAKYIDATLGGGGYTLEILKRGGIVLGIDLDQDAIDFVRSRIQKSDVKARLGEDLILVQGNFRDIEKIAHLNNFEEVLGVVFDLGLSSAQIEGSGRGFSFLKDEPLDMRMDSKGELTAEIIVNKWSEEQLYELFTKMGEERFSSSIIHNITRARRVRPITSSLMLAGIVKDAVTRKGTMHPATRIFQALRIAVNDELNNIKFGISGAFEILRSGGRLGVVSFHSLEDRIVKNSFRLYKSQGKAEIITKKPIIPNIEEIKENRRSRSAKLRYIEKL